MTTTNPDPSHTVHPRALHPRWRSQRDRRAPLGGGGSTVDSEVFKRQAPGLDLHEVEGPLRRRAGSTGPSSRSARARNERFYGSPKLRTPPQILNGGGSSRRWAVVWPCCGRRCKQPRAVRTTSAGSRAPGEKSPGDHEVERPREASEKGV